MSSESSRQDSRPRRLKPIKAWAVVNYNGKLAGGDLDGDELLGSALAIYPRRYLAAIVASTSPELRVVPVQIRSLQHHKR